VFCKKSYGARPACFGRERHQESSPNSSFSEEEILQLHGMGNSSLIKLQSMMHEFGLTYKQTVK
jgi:hypothetical protein